MLGGERIQGSAVDLVLYRYGRRIRKLERLAQGRGQPNGRCAQPDAARREGEVGLSRPERPALYVKHQPLAALDDEGERQLVRVGGKVAHRQLDHLLVALLQGTAPWSGGNDLAVNDGRLLDLFVRGRAKVHPRLRLHVRFGRVLEGPSRRESTRVSNEQPQSLLRRSLDARWKHKIEATEGRGGGRVQDGRWLPLHRHARLLLCRGHVIELVVDLFQL
mmetsp:Transcript_29907/g.88917  ORF Transcript_29907/g.88917 Transcript_29907/m.88917 type:complete len:219 (+) Transcript_29907:1427-2083(+)